MKSSFSTLAEKKCRLYTIFKSDTAPPEPPAEAASASSVQTIELLPFRVRHAIRVDDLGADWDGVGGSDDLLLARAYLRVLEAAPPAGLGLAYLLFYREGQPVGKAVLQYVDFAAADHIKAQREEDGSGGFGDLMKRALAQRLQYRVLVCGNMLFTGEHAFAFDRSLITEESALSLLERSLDRLAARGEAMGGPVDAVLIKDVRASRRRMTGFFTARAYHRIAFQPNMILELRPEWRSLPDYLDSLTSKYRVRARRAFKKARRVERRPLSTAAVEELEPRLYELYRAVAEDAEFNMLSLHPSYLSTLKQQLPERFRVTAYYQEDALLGFYTTLRNGRELEAHFLGFDPLANQRYQLYLNMLYDMIEEGIEAGAEVLVFARTAMEIKSSVGARAVDMDLLLRANHSWFNKVVPSLIRLLEPKVEWTPRNPFR